ncbi:hypothetical protein U8P68_16180 [Rhizobium ruizarguesonis]|nr:hypothetical protein U8P68_16180 [Rhizobium ruizarguesonis]
MKRRLVAWVFLIVAGAGVLPAGTSDAGGVPFSASLNVPDYKASMIVRDPYPFHDKPKEYSRSVFHHDGWTRVEEIQGNETNIAYGSALDNVVLWTRRFGDEDFTRVDIDKTKPREARETGDADNQAGESCKWSEITSKGSQDGPIWLSCLSGDGIEIGEKVLFSSKELMTETRLVRLERKPVADYEVRPPKRLFDPGFWLKPFRDYPDRPADRVDFEARMTGMHSDLRILRHYPWQSEERRGKDGSVRFTVWNDLENQGINLIYSKREYSLQAFRSPLDPAQPFNQLDAERGQADLKRRDNHLDESCAWFNMTPDSADAGRMECLTPDGVPLKVDAWAWGGDGEIYTAAEIKRRPVDLKEMLPPRELIEPSAWGFTVGD